MLQGALYLISFPFSDGSGRKVRPVVVVSKNEYNEGADVLICAITSHTAAQGIFINSSHLQKGVLHTSSCIKPFSLHVMEKSLFLKEIGVLNDETMLVLREQLRSYF
jgi:mRNA-degrading endonuclease toxin of MazEF toxin-antitoxin module